jgi:hypothetical protein
MSRGVLLQQPPQQWRCPNCQREETTPPAPPGTVQSRFHVCPRLGGLTAPMLPAGVDAKVEAQPWGDMLNGELVQRDDDGRPMSSIVTTRADGSNDVVALAPSARIALD